MHHSPPFIPKITLHQQQGGFTGIVPSKYNHLDLSCSSLCDEHMLVLSTAMYPNFSKIPVLVRVNRLLQVYWLSEPILSHVDAHTLLVSPLGKTKADTSAAFLTGFLTSGTECAYVLVLFRVLNAVREEQVMKCVEDCPYPVLHVRPKSRPPTPEPYGLPPNLKKQQKLKKIAVKKSIRVAEPKESMPLQTLNVSQNSISCQGFSAFLSCLAHRGVQDTLMVLDVSRTDIAVAGGRVLAQFLSKCLFIQRLDCRLIDAAMCA